MYRSSVLQGSATSIFYFFYTERQVILLLHHVTKLCVGGCICHTTRDGHGWKLQLRWRAEAHKWMYLSKSFCPLNVPDLSLVSVLSLTGEGCTLQELPSIKPVWSTASTTTASSSRSETTSSPLTLWRSRRPPLMVYCISYRCPPEIMPDLSYGQHDHL